MRIFCLSEEHFERKEGFLGQRRLSEATTKLQRSVSEGCQLRWQPGDLLRARGIQVAALCYFNVFFICMPEIVNPAFLYSAWAVMLSPNTCNPTALTFMDFSSSSIAWSACLPYPFPRNASSRMKS